MEESRRRSRDPNEKKEKIRIVFVKTHIEEKICDEGRKKRKRSEEETDKKKMKLEDDKKSLQRAVHRVSEEKEDKEDKERKRPRSPQDPLEGGSGCKKPCLEVKRPAPLEIHNYKFHKELGKGSFGQVMLASFAPKKKLVAIKTISKKIDKSNYKSISREARILKMAKSCPFLCHLHAAFQSEVQAFFVLEYACGGSLYNIILKKGKLPTETIQFYTAEIIIGLQFLHSNGIVHRDLKPDNILVDRGGHIRICDFGISVEGLFDKKIICGLCGTPGYRAPEVLIMEYYNAGADWWSLGVIIYEMATAKQPFSPSVSVVKEFISIKTPEYPSHMSQELQDLLSKLLEKDRKQRLGVNGNIREHPFYASINWENLEKKRVKAPFQPQMPFTSELRVISPGLSVDTTKRERVEELSYVDPSWHWQE